MDLIIKNLERLKDYSDGNHKPIERVVVDFDKLATEDFTQIFFDACEKYAEVGESYLVHNKDIRWRMSLERKCINCKYCELDSTQEPCRSCWKSIENRPNWEPKEYAKREAIDRMTNDISEFMEINHNNVVFDKGFQRFEVTLILTTGMDKEEDDKK